MGYKIYYNQDIDNVSTTQSIDTFDNIFTLNPLNSPWGSAGCYAGATPANGSQMGTYSVATWSGFSEELTLSDMRDASVRPVSGDSTQNLRFMVRFNSDLAYTVGRQSFKWTGIRPELAELIKSQIETNLNLAHYTIDSPYTRSEQQIGLNSAANSPLLNAPLTSLKINELVFLPRFIFVEREYYNYNAQMGGYQNLSTGTSYTKLWSEIKPEDKTAAGADFDSDFFDNGWKEIQAVNPDGRRFVHCVGVALQPYYGKSSYRLVNDAYVQSTNPDDGKVYGARQQFGSPLTPQNESPSIVNNYYRAPYLYVMTENYDNNAGGVYYSTPTGIYFTHHVDSSQIYFNGYTISSNYQKLGGASSSWNPAIYAGNSTYNNVYRDFNSGEPMSTDLSIYSSVSENDIVISPIYNITDPYRGTIFYLQNNGQAYSFNLNSRSVSPITTHIYPISNLWATIASLGCYVAADAETATKAQTGAYTGENNSLYLGFMDASGITNGTMLQGGDIVDSTQAGIDDIIQNTPYTPIKPGPTPDPGGDDPDDPSRPKDDTGNVGLNDISNLSIGGVSSFLTAWVLNDQQIINLARRLWSTINSNTEEDAKAMLSNFYRIQHRTYDPDNPDDQPVDYELSLAEIPDYFIGLKWFPFDVASNFSTISSGESGIRVGTGASLISTGGTTTQFLQGATAQLNGGTISVPYTYESYLDLEPYTSATIYIPYCGTTSIQPSLIMGRTLTITYAISGLTGSICAIVLVSSGSIQYPLCVMNGMCGFDIAISGNTQNAQIRNALTARDNYYLGQWQTISGGIASIGKTGAISGALGKFSNGYDAGFSRENISDFASDVNRLGLKDALSSAKEWNAGLYNGAISAAAGLSLGSSIAKAVADPIANKISYENQLPFTMGTQPLVVGSSSSMANLILPQTAFVQIRRKNRHELGQQAYGNTYGYESKNMKRIGDLTGFIKCVNPKVSISGALQSEMEEIYGLLSTGIYRN